MRSLRNRRANRRRTQRIEARKPEGTLADWEDAHPAIAEALAIQTALYLAKIAGAHLYVVHLSSHQGLEVVRAARRAGMHFTVETTTPYLGINSHDPNGFLVKMVPPVRTPEHQTALWQGFLEGSINTVGTDNTSRARATKRPEAGLHGARPGLPALGTHLPALLHYGRLRGIPLEVLVERATRSPARVYGIYPQKGTIAVGSDADLVVVDLDLERVVRAEDLQGMSDFSPFEGKNAPGLAGRDHQGRQDHRARRQDRRQGQWPLSAAQDRLRRGISSGSDAPPSARRARRCTRTAFPDSAGRHRFRPRRFLRGRPPGRARCPSGCSRTSRR